MDRRRALILLGGGGLLAGCAGHASPLLHLPGSSGDPARPVAGFPRRRPDGSLPPSNAAFYRPSRTIVGTPAPRTPDVSHICISDSCPDSGGGTSGPQPNTALHAGGVRGYYFASQNYAETWNDDGSALLAQWYWSIDVSQWVAQVGGPDFDNSNVGGPTKPCDTCTTRTSSVSVNISTPGRMFSASHDNGWNITGTVDASGNVTLTVNARGETASSTIAYTPPSASCSLGAFQCAAAIAPIVLNGLGATATYSPASSAGGILVGAMAAGTLSAMQQWEAADC